MKADAASVEQRAGQSITLAGWNPRASLSRIGWAVPSIIVFSSCFMVTRLSVTHKLRMRDAVALRLGVGALPRRIVSFSPTPSLPSEAWLEGLSFAALWCAPFVFLIALALRLTSTAHAFAIVPVLMPIFAGFIRWWALREPPGGLRRPGLVIIGGLAALAIGNALSDGRSRYHCPSSRDRRGAGRSRSGEMPFGFGATVAVGEFLAARAAPSQKHCQARLSAGESS